MSCSGKRWLLSGGGGGQAAAAHSPPGAAHIRRLPRHPWRLLQHSQALGALQALFANLPTEAYAGAMEKSGVSPASLGTGYLLFFFYSALIGVVGIVLAFMVAARQTPRLDHPADEAGPAEASSSVTP